MIPTPRLAAQIAAWTAAWAWVGAMPPGAAAQVQPTSPASGSTDLPVVEHELENGMRFLLLPRPGAPIVALALDVAVGSLDDPPGQKGVSHFLEHLLFKGSTTIGTRDVEGEYVLFRSIDAVQDSLSDSDDPSETDRLRARMVTLEDSARALAVPDEFSAIYARNGARGLNATTGYHQTRFTVSLPSNRLELWFALESDRFRAPVFRDFFAERRVVLEERRSRLEAVPGSTLRAAALAAAFPEHGYGVPPIGYREDLEAIGRADVEAFYRERFRPDRMTAAIVGDFEVSQAVDWAERYFGRLQNPPSAPPPTPDPAPISQGNERRVLMTLGASPQLQIGWRIPGSPDPDTPALLVLTNLLVGSRDARLTSSLVTEGGPAASVVADLGPGSLHTRLFTIQATPRDGRTVEEVETAIYREIERLLAEPPTAAELERIRTRLEAAEARGRVSGLALAAELLSASGRGDWRAVFSVQQGMRTVESADIVRVIERYLRLEGRTVAILEAESPDADP